MGIYGEQSQLKRNIYGLLSPGSFIRVEEFTESLVLVNYIYHLKITCHVNNIFKQFYWFYCSGYGYVFLLPVITVCITSYIAFDLTPYPQKPISQMMVYSRRFK